MRKIADFRYSGSRDDSVTERELRGAALARRAASEGIVLLKNEGGLLPLNIENRVALLGGGAAYTIKGGTGSGDVNERKSVSIWEGLKAADADIVSEQWLKDYEERYTAAREAWRDLILAGASEGGQDFFDMYSTHPFIFPEGRPVTSVDIKGADVAVYVISRIAGEGKDRVLTEGDYYLTAGEKADIEFLNSQNIPVVLLINAGAPVEIADVSELPCVRSIIFMAQAGQEGGNAVADVLYGKVNSSGRLTATWAAKYSDYPNADTFSGLSGDVTKEHYTEGIYVGYRYFDTFDVKPLYSFGHGLSFTSFEYKDIKVSQEGEVLVDARVVNKGDVAGKEVVQVYISCPQNGLDKEKRRLAGFTKTKEIGPGESAEIRIEIAPKQFASFDEEKGAWVIEAGEYGILIGGSLDTAKLCCVLEQDEEVILEHTDHICSIQEELIELLPYKIADSEQSVSVEEASVPHIKACFTACDEESSEDVQDEVRKEAAEIVSRLPAKEWIPLLVGEISRSQNVIGSAGIRVPGSAGETSSAYIESLGLAAAVMADGPAGLRLTKKYYVDKASGEVYDVGFIGSIEHGLFKKVEKPEGSEEMFQYCTAFPVGTMLAQTFNTDLVEEVGALVAEEMTEYHVSWWLAPGMNIQRNPLCGRNFEYYSEDPLLSGKVAAAMTRGVQSIPGTGTTIKHFACNNQEDNRIGSDSIISERALREIYLRGFEIAVKESQPECIMTSYNLVNGIHAANSYDLCTKVLRDEWGFEGIVMSDWATTRPEAGTIPHKCAQAGNDIIMPGTQDDLDDILDAYEKGILSEEDILTCAERMVRAILKSNAYER